MTQAATISQRTAANVRAELARRGVSARTAATALTWSHSRMARRLNGLTPFDVTELSEIALYLGLPMSTFIEDAA